MTLTACAPRDRGESLRVKKAREVNVMILATGPITAELLPLITDLSAPVISSACGPEAVIKRVTVLRGDDKETPSIVLPVITFETIRRHLSKAGADLPVEREEANTAHRELFAKAPFPKELTIARQDKDAGPISWTKRIFQDSKLTNVPFVIDNRDRGAGDPWNKIDVVPHAEAWRRLDEAICAFIAAEAGAGPRVPLVVILPAPPEPPAPPDSASAHAPPLPTASTPATPTATPTVSAAADLKPPSPTAMASASATPTVSAAAKLKPPPPPAPEPQSTQKAVKQNAKTVADKLAVDGVQPDPPH